MLAKRIIPCLDVKDGRTVKGINFEGLRDVGDAVALGSKYAREGADELVYLDISATQEGRNTFTHLVSRIAQEIDIPFTVGGGIGTIDEWVSTLSDIMVREKVDANADRPIVVVNHRGMYDGMIAQLAATNDSPFARGKRVDRSIAVADIEQLLQTLTHVSTKV